MVSTRVKQLVLLVNSLVNTAGPAVSSKNLICDTFYSIEWELTGN